MKVPRISTKHFEYQFSLKCSYRYYCGWWSPTWDCPLSLPFTNFKPCRQIFEKFVPQKSRFLIQLMFWWCFRYLRCRTYTDCKEVYPFYPNAVGFPTLTKVMQLLKMSGILTIVFNLCETSVMCILLSCEISRHSSAERSSAHSTKITSTWNQPVSEETERTQH